ncbi:MAG: single-stranded-DNA-specific exonuclease RecJ [Chloroflexota bacterium]
MNPLKKQWQVAARLTPEAENNLSKYPPILRQILFNRGYATVDSADEFLKAEQFTDNAPLGLMGVGEAVERIEFAIKNGEKITIFGDYDTDGVTSTALGVETLSSLGADVHAYIPDRFAEGYGLNTNALDKLKQEGTNLIITVDCGIRAFNEAEHAHQIGLDLIITDHHSVGDELPRSTALINAKQVGDEYPDKNLAGVGTMYKLASALIDKLGGENIDSQQLLDLVALGTVADLVPLEGENRTLVRKGIREIRRQRRQGLLSLIGVAGLKAPQIKASHIGFILGPRLNAAGRLGSAMSAYDLLVANDVSVAGILAQELDNTNRKRQKITEAVMEASEEKAMRESPDAAILFSADEAFNLGIVGLAASRLVDRYYRPAVVANRGAEFTRASCRSIAEFHITEALEQCSDLLEHFGGHAAAAGFTVRNDNWDEFVDRMQAIASKQLSGQELLPTLNAEAEVELKDLSAELLSQMEWLEPTGYGNPEPQFVTRDVQVQQSKTVGQDGSHLKLTVADGHKTFDAIAFRQGYLQDEITSRIDVLYSLEMNEFRGQKTLQLNVRDIHPSG